MSVSFSKTTQIPVYKKPTQNWLVLSAFAIALSLAALLTNSNPANAEGRFRVHFQYGLQSQDHHGQNGKWQNKNHNWQSQWERPQRVLPMPRLLRKLRRQGYYDMHKIYRPNRKVTIVHATRLGRYKPRQFKLVVSNQSGEVLKRKRLRSGQNFGWNR